MSNITLPYDINNGDALDADKVMANENAIVTEYNAEIGAKAGSVVTTAEPQTLENKTADDMDGTLLKPTIKGSTQAVTTHAPEGAGTTTLDLAASNVHAITLPAAAQTLAISNATVGQFFAVEINNVTSQGALTWFSTIRWVGGTAPTLTGTNGKRDTFMFRVTGDGTYDGYIVGMNI